MTTEPGRGGARHPLVELTLARLREFFREPEAIFWAFIFPLVLSVALAAAFPSRADRPIVAAVAEGSARARVVETLDADPVVVVRDLSPAEERTALREGRVHIVVVPGEPPTYRFDPAREESRLARAVVDAVLQRASGRADRWAAHEERVAVPGTRYIDWLIPGLVGMGIMTNGLWAVAFPIVQARLRKLLKRLMASPMRRREYLLAHMLARMIFLVPETVVPLAFGRFAFGMPIVGSIAALAGVIVIGACAFSAIGLLMASRAKTIEGASGLLNAVQVPMWLMSGVFFSSANFPDIAQPVIRLLPLTALVDALRSVTLDGAGVGDVSSELAVLGVWGVAAFVGALRWFRWR